MIEIKINEIKRDITTITDSWIREHISSRIFAGEKVCIRIYIRKNNVDIALSCGECESKMGASSRSTTADENRLFDLWGRLKCEEQPLDCGRLIQFLSEAS